MSVSYGGDSIVFADGSVNSSGFIGHRNRIINGAMMIDQRNAGTAVTTDGAYPVDRFQAYEDTDGTYSAQRDTTAPAGFVNSLKWTTTTADSSLSASQYSGIYHAIEGLNTADLMWGTANAQTVTLSFWVRSSLTGTFGGSLRNNVGNRSYPFTYTISVANTFEYKTVTIAGDTGGSGTWLTNNSAGIKLFFGLGVGSNFSGTAGAWAGNNYLSATSAVSVIGTLNATFYITGVQLERGSTASSFEYRPYGTELALCQRYLPAFNAVAASDPICSAYMQSTTAMRAVFVHKVPTRVAPTGLTATAGSTFQFSGTAGVNGSGSLSFLGASTEVSWFVATMGATTAGVGGAFLSQSPFVACQILLTGCEI